MHHWNILVVEDDPDGQEVVGRILRHHKVKHGVADSAEAALEMLREGQYSSVIIDLHLPGIDGWTLLRKIDETYGLSNLPCIAITAFHSAEVAVQAIEAGFEAYFPKPLEATSFVRELTSILS
jgi:CheY-like chemotaxis protein